MTAIAAGLPHAALILASLALFRALPVLGYLAVSLRWSRRLAILLFFGGVVALGVRADPGLARFLVGIAAGCGYLIAVAALLYRVAPRLPLRAIRLGAVLVPAAVLCVLLPGVCRGWLPLGVIAIGWETMLSAHSYFIDTAAQPRCWRGYLFFVFVDPTVVFRERGVRIGDPRLDLRGVLRIAAGLLAMLGHDAILLAMVWLAPRAGYLGFLRTQVPLGIALYCAHSGLASLQIGYLRCLGYRLPERYRYPLFATSPQDFWHRWNTWIGRWGYRYLFLPLGLSLPWRGRGRALLAALATFGVIGALHDLAIYAMRGGAPAPRMTLVFLAAALAFPAFAPIQRALKHAPRRLAPILAWLLWFHLGLGLAWLAIPVLRDNRLPFEAPPRSALVAHNG